MTTRKTFALAALLAAALVCTAGCQKDQPPPTTQPAARAAPASQPAPPKPPPVTTRPAPPEVRKPLPPGENWVTGRPYVVRRARGKITVDGKYHKEQWHHAMVIKDFKTPVALKPAKSPTDARLLWDDQCLYVNIRASDRDLKATLKKRTDPLYNEDVVELFIKPYDGKPPYYEFEINPLGTWMALEIPERKKVSVKGCSNWDPGLKSAVQVAGTLNNDADLDNYYRAVLAIPWKNLKYVGGKPPKVGQTFKFTVCRYDYSKYLPSSPEEQTSAPLTNQSFHHHADYSTMKFAE